MNLSERLALELIRVLPKDKCIEWSGAKTSDGYPMLTTDGKQVLVTRYVKAITDEIPMPPSSIVCRHTCDNPPCINPEHLIWGTMKDNSQDAIQRNRTARGQRLPQSKLTDVDVVEARALFLQTDSLLAVTTKYGLGNNAATQMLTGKTYSHVHGAISENQYKEATRRIIPAQELERIRSYRIQGWSWKKIADVMNYGSAMTPWRIHQRGLDDGNISKNPDTF